MSPLLPEAMSSPFLYRIKRFTSVNRLAAQANGPRADVVRGAIEACRLEAREPAGVRPGGGGDAV